MSTDVTLESPPEEKPKKEITRLSYSAVSTFRRCGEQFRLTRVIGLREQPSWASVGGRAAHAVTEARDLWREFGIDNEKPSEFGDALDVEIANEEKWTGVPKSEWKAGGRASKEWPDKQGEKWWRAEGPLMVGRWEQWLNSRPGMSIAQLPDGRPGVEVEVKGTLGGVEILGYVDRVLVSEHGPGAVDLKFGSKTPDNQEQNGLYGLMYEQMFGERLLWATFFMGRTGTATPPELLDRWYDGTLDPDYALAWKLIQEGSFLASPGQHCDFLCGVKPYCRLMGTNDKRLTYLPSPVLPGPRKGLES